MTRRPRHPLAPLLLVGFALGTAACEAGLREQTTEQFTVSLSTDPPVRAGQETVTVNIVPKGSDPAKDLEVLFHYYPFVHRVKDSLASPDEVARVVPASLGSSGYQATLELDRAGPWKIAVRTKQADKPDTIVYFTIYAEESPAAGEH